MENFKYHIKLPNFTERNIPITEIAKVMGKDPQYIRIALQNEIFKFGYAMKMENSSEYHYYCPDRKVWEEIGYFREEPKQMNETGGKDIVERSETNQSKYNVYKWVMRTAVKANLYGGGGNQRGGMALVSIYSLRKDYNCTG